MVWLEIGNDTKGLTHIVCEHSSQFADKGITEAEIPSVLMGTLQKGKIIDYQGQGTGRPVFEATYNGKKFKLAITYGDNGYIVGANPRNTLSQ